MTKAAPSVHPCIEYGHNNSYFNPPIGTFINEDGETKPKYTVRGCTKCGQQVCYDYESKTMIPVATMFRSISSVYIPDYLQDSYLNWLKFSS